MGQPMLTRGPEMLTTAQYEDNSSQSRKDAWEAACAAAETAIISRLVETFEEVRLHQGLSVSDVTGRACLSKRTVSLIRVLRTRPSLRTLISLAEAHGLELTVRVRARRREPAS